MAITQARTVTRKRMNPAVDMDQIFPWAASAQARKLGIVFEDGKYYLGDLRLTAQNFSTIVNQLKALGKVIARGSVH
jgi:hypothetical protein